MAAVRTQLQVVPHASVPLILIAALAVGVAFVAVVVAAIPGRIAAEVSTVDLLRSE